MFKEKFAMLKSSFIVSIISTFSTLFAFIAQLILAKSFGASIEMDAYFAAIAIPLTFIRFLSVPLQFVFVPMYKEVEEKKGYKESLNFYSLFFWGFLFFFLITGVLVYIFNLPLSELIVAGATKNTKILTADLLKVLAFYIFFAGLYFTTQALHIVKKSFNTPYFANAISSLTIFLYTYFFISSQGIYAAVYGLLLGAVLEFLVNFIFLPQKIILRVHFDKQLIINFLRLFVPFSLGVVVYKSTPIIERYFASFLSKGDISVLGYANKIIESVVGFLATGLSLVLLPITSELSAKDENKGLSNIFSWGIRAVGFLVMPVLFYLGFFSKFFISAIFERGNFTPGTSNKLGGVMIYYIGAIFALSLGNQITNIFYSKKKHMKVVFINVILMSIYILLLWLLSKHYGIIGIASAYSIITITTIILFVINLLPLLSVNWKEILQAYFKFFISSLIMALVLILINPYLSALGHTLLIIITQGIIGFSSYLILLYILKAKELLTIIKNIKI